MDGAEFLSWFFKIGRNKNHRLIDSARYDRERRKLIAEIEHNEKEDNMQAAASKALGEWYEVVLVITILLLTSLPSSLATPSVNIRDPSDQARAMRKCAKAAAQYDRRNIGPAGLKVTITYIY